MSAEVWYRLAFAVAGSLVFVILAATILLGRHDRSEREAEHEKNARLHAETQRQIREAILELQHPARKMK